MQRIQPCAELRSWGITLPFTTEGDEAFMPAIFTAHAQESVVEATVYEVIVELLLDEGG